MGATEAVAAVATALSEGEKIISTKIAEDNTPDMINAKVMAQIGQIVDAHRATIANHDLTTFRQDVAPSGNPAN